MDVEKLANWQEHYPSCCISGDVISIMWSNCYYKCGTRLGVGRDMCGYGVLVYENQLSNPENIPQVLDEAMRPLGVTSPAQYRCRMTAYNDDL